MAADQADVRSIDAVRDWHATLVGYADSLNEALAGVDLEIRRAYEWLDEQLAAWKQAVRDCEDEVVQAKAELSQRKYQTWDGREPDCTVQEKALRLAKARLQHAEEKVITVRQWIGRLPKLMDETYLGHARRLRNFLEDDLPKGQTELARRLAALEAYAGLRPDFASAPSSASVSPSPVGEESSDKLNPPTPFPKREGGEDKAPSPEARLRSRRSFQTGEGLGEGLGEGSSS